MHQITMPQAGNTMEDGTVVRWLKAEGETIEAGQVLLEIETDKAKVEIESSHSGTLLKILCAEGKTVPVHTVIALVGQPGEDVSAAVAEAQAAAPAGAAGGGEGVERPAPAPEAEQPGAAPAPKPPKGTVTPVLMPQVGNTMEEGTIRKWLVKPGDAIEEGSVIFEVETDKANVEVEAVDSGRLARIVVAEGQTVAIKTPVAYLADADADVDAYLASRAEPAEAAPPAPPAGQAAAVAPAPAPAAPQAAAPAPTPVTSPSGRVKASPAARKLARRRGIDLAALGAGSGPGGRILSSDLDRAPAAAAPPPPAPAAQPARKPMSPMRRAIARNLLTSKQTIPHFYMTLTIDAEAMMAFYRARKAQHACTVNDVVVMACARALVDFPAVRSRLDGEEMLEFPTANIGIAVGTETGLVVPVLVAAERLNFRQLAGETSRIVAAARGGKIESMGHGVMTITNLGMFGVEEFSAIINPPESAILAVGAVREDVVVRDGAIRPARVMTLTLSADHRIVDGLVAAKFLARLREVLEAPEGLT